MGRYQIINRIATGGMAEVYLAVHGELAGFRTPVVIKRVLPHLACNQQFIDMFLDEARIASLLDHPNVVRIYEVGHSESEYFLVMELVQGKPFSMLLRSSQEKDHKNRLDAKLSAAIVAQAAEGLHYAHEMQDASGAPLGLVHRDVSPHNIMVSFEGSVKVIDFGIARALGRITDTQTGSLKGKFGYMSPEQARGEEVDRRTDVFSLGVVLWEALCGRKLFHRENDMATMRALIYDAIPKPSSLASVPLELESIVIRALSRQAAYRFQTARDLASALQRWVNQAGGAGTADIGTAMKSSFGPDVIAWQQMVRTAQSAAPDPEATRPGVTSTNTDLGAMSGVTGSTQARTTHSLPPAPGLAAKQRTMLLVGATVVALAVVGAVVVSLANRSKPADRAALAPAAAPSGPSVQHLPSRAVTPPAPQPALWPPVGSRGKPARPGSERRKTAASEVPHAKPAGARPPDRRPNPF